MSFSVYKKIQKKEKLQLTELRRAAQQPHGRCAAAVHRCCGCGDDGNGLKGGEVVATVASASATMVTPAPAVLLLVAVAVDFLWRLEERRRLREVEELMAVVRRRR